MFVKNAKGVTKKNHSFRMQLSTFFFLSLIYDAECVLGWFQSRVFVKTSCFEIIWILKFLSVGLCLIVSVISAVSFKKIEVSGNPDSKFWIYIICECLYKLFTRIIQWYATETHRRT